MTKIITFVIILKIYVREAIFLSKKDKIIIPENHTATEFLRGKASKIFEEVSRNDTVVVVNKNSKPQNVIISYDRYIRLKKEGAKI